MPDESPDTLAADIEAVEEERSKRAAAASGVVWQASPPSPEPWNGTERRRSEADRRQDERRRREERARLAGEPLPLPGYNTSGRATLAPPEAWRRFDEAFEGEVGPLDVRTGDNEGGGLAE